jgi:hypothetical protein
VFGPSRPDLSLGREFASCCGLPGHSNRRSLILRENDGRGCFRPGKLQYDPGNVVLGVCRQTARDLQGSIQQLGHVCDYTPFGTLHEGPFGTIRLEPVEQRPIRR